MATTTYHLALQEVRLGLGARWGSLGDGLNFTLIRSGALHFTWGSDSQIVSSGDVVVVSGSPGAALSPARGRDASFAWFSARLDHLYPLFESTEISQLNRVAERFHRPRHYLRDSELAAQCHRLLAEVPKSFTLEHRTQLLLLVSNILSAELSHGELPGVHAGGPDSHFLRIVERISPDEFVGVGVEELAKRFGYGRRHLNRLFHRHFGTSVAALRMELRLTKAVSLLRDPGTKITAIAADCGFNHLGLFNACFKKRFGVSPGTWRKETLHGAGGGPEDQLPSSPASLADLVSDRPMATPDVLEIRKGTGTPLTRTLATLCPEDEARSRKSNPPKSPKIIPLPRSTRA